MPNHRVLHTLRSITRIGSGFQAPITTTTTTTTTVAQWQCMEVFLKEYSSNAVARFFTFEDGEIYPPNECDICRWEAVDNEIIKNGVLDQSQQLYIWMNISGISSISFDWKISSEEGYDFAYFTIQDVYENNIFQAETSGQYDWDTISFNSLDSQQDYLIIWSYSKDGSVNSGDDCVYLRGLVIN